MKSQRSLEKVLYGSEDNHDFYYPIIGQEDFVYMAIESASDRSYVMCFPYFRSMENRKYLDIYVWDNILPDGYKRFAIQQGYALPEEDEEMFLEYLQSSDILVADALYKNCVNRIKEEYPEIHLKCYSDWRQTLLHVYFTSFRAGPHEILFKANLNFLASGLSRTNEYNLIGTSPDKIFGVQLGMLQSLNSAFGAETLESLDNRRWARYLYARFHNLIHGSEINKYQWEYLKEQGECEGFVDKQRYRFLGELSCDKDYYTFLKYEEQKKIVDAYYSILPRFPDEIDLEEYSEICDTIQWYIENEEELDECLQEKARKYKDTYSYETREYVVMIPTSLREVLGEAESQHNCLYKYVMEMAYDNVTFILFIREKGREKDSLITVEVKDEVIEQAYRAYNRETNEKERRFLEEYAALKNLIFPQNDYYDWDDDYED